MAAFTKPKSGPSVTIDDLLRSEDKKDWEYVDIPKVNALNWPYDDIWLNHHKFEAGKKHFVPKEIADSIKERMKAYEYEVLRINSDARRLELFRTMNKDAGTAEV